jgi:hypothetical protein
MLNYYLCTHGKYYNSFFKAYYTYIVSSDDQNILHPFCKSLEIFSFTKYSIYGAAIHKAHFLLHWIDLHYLYCRSGFTTLPPVLQQEQPDVVLSLVRA